MQTIGDSSASSCWHLTKQIQLVRNVCQYTIRVDIMPLTEVILSIAAPPETLWRSRFPETSLLDVDLTAPTIDNSPDIEMFYYWANRTNWNVGENPTSEVCHPWNSSLLLVFLTHIVCVCTDVLGRQKDVRWI